MTLKIVELFILRYITCQKDCITVEFSVNWPSHDICTLKYLVFSRQQRGILDLSQTEGQGFHEMNPQAC